MQSTLVAPRTGAPAPTPSVRQTLASVGVAVVVGLGLILNQYGEVLNGFWDLSWLQPLWAVNSGVTWISYGAIMGLLGVMVATHHLIIRDDNMRWSFHRGLLTGILVVPIFAAAIAAAVAAVIVAIKIVRVLWMIILVVLTPVRWVAEHIIAPLLEIISWPFAWLGKNIVWPFISLISTPFVWVWDVALGPLLHIMVMPFVWMFRNVVSPVSSFLVRRLVLPVLLVVLGAVAALVVLTIPAAYGRVFLDDLRVAAGASLSASEMFSHGCGLGFIIFNTVFTFALMMAGLSSAQPAVATLAVLAIPALFITRQAAGAISYPEALQRSSYQTDLTQYWAKSKMSVITQFAVLPIAVLLYIAAGGDTD
jgi:hypothetical protein